MSNLTIKVATDKQAEVILNKCYEANNLFDKKGKPHLIRIANHISIATERYYDTDRGTIWVNMCYSKGENVISITLFNNNSENKSLYVYSFYPIDRNIETIDKIESYLKGEINFEQL